MQAFHCSGGPEGLHRVAARLVADIQAAACQAAACTVGQARGVLSGMAAPLALDHSAKGQTSDWHIAKTVPSR